MSGFDVRAHAAQDIRDRAALAEAVKTCDGVVHLAAVSRVVLAEHDPALCTATNIEGVQNVLDAANAAERQPWVINASSREVYGHPVTLPVSESSPIAPVNVYGRSKAEGEARVRAARARGQRACTVRLSNVYGHPLDHADRVIPAFARAAALGGTLRVEGRAHTFDFTHVDDVSDALSRLVARLASGAPAPEPLHFVSGVPTTLGALADLAITLGGGRATVVDAPPRTFDVARFLGAPERAYATLGWRATTRLADGLERLIRAFRDEARGAIAP